MARILLRTGYEGIDVDQTFSEIVDRTEKSKNGFIYLTQGGVGRYFNTVNFSYVVDQPVPEADPQKPIDHSVPDAQMVNVVEALTSPTVSL